MLLIVFARVFEVKSLRQVVIDLDCTQLPATANGIFDHKVKFGPVESGFSILNYSGQSLLLACFYNSLFCTIPILIAPDIFLAIIFVAEWYLSFEVLKFECLEYDEYNIHHLEELVFYLLGRTEDVRIVLGKATHTG